MRLLSGPLRRRELRLLVAGSTVSLVGDGIYTVAIAVAVLHVGGTRRVAGGDGRGQPGAAGGVRAAGRRPGRPAEPARRGRGLRPGSAGRGRLAGAAAAGRQPAALGAAGPGGAARRGLGRGGAGVQLDGAGPGPRGRAGRRERVARQREPDGPDGARAGARRACWRRTTSGWPCWSTLRPSGCRRSACCCCGRSPSTTRGPRPLPWADFREGLAYVRRTPWLATNLLAGLVITFAVSGSITMLPFLVSRGYHAPVASFGYLIAVGGVAATVAAVVAGSRPAPRRPLAASYADLRARARRHRRARAGAERAGRRRVRRGVLRRRDGRQRVPGQRSRVAGAARAARPGLVARLGGGDRGLHRCPSCVAALSADHVGIRPTYRAAVGRAAPAAALALGLARSTLARLAAAAAGEPVTRTRQKRRVSASSKPRRAS